MENTLSARPRATQEPPVDLFSSLGDGGQTTEQIATTNITVNNIALQNGTIGGLKIIYEPYQIVWTSHVLFRVTMIVIVMAFTLIGNLSLIFIISCHRKLRQKRVNIFLFNLAVGDLMVCLVTMTTEILFVAFGEWVLGAAACKLIVYGQIVTLASATFLLTGMSIDRYQVIVQPLQSLRGQPKIWRKVCTAWVLALFFALPQMFIFVQTDEGVHPDGVIKHMCRSRGYTAPWQRKLYFTFLATYILIIPTSIMSFCYINIIKVVWMRTDSGEERNKPKFRFVSKFKHLSSQRDRGIGSGSFGDAGSLRSGSVCGTPNKLRLPKRLVSSSKRNVIKMTLSVIIGFVICWTPYFLISLVRIYSNYQIRISVGLSVAEIMALVHSALNPILYGIFSTKMARRVCRQICGKKEPYFKESAIFSEDETVTLSESRLQRLSVFSRVDTPTSSGASWRRTVSIGSCYCCCPAEDTATPDPARPLLIYRKLVMNGGRKNDAIASRPSGHYDSCHRSSQSSFIIKSADEKITTIDLEVSRPLISNARECGSGGSTDNESSAPVGHVLTHHPLTLSPTVSSSQSNNLTPTVEIASGSQETRNSLTETENTAPSTGVKTDPEVEELENAISNESLQHIYSGSDSGCEMEKEMKEYLATHTS